MIKDFLGSTSVSSTKFIHRSKRVLQLPIDIGNFAVNLRSFFKLSSGRREDYSHLQDVTEVTAHYVLRHSSVRWFPSRHTDHKCTYKRRS